MEKKWPSPQPYVSAAMQLELEKKLQGACQGAVDTGEQFNLYRFGGEYYTYYANSASTSHLKPGVVIEAYVDPNAGGSPGWVQVRWNDGRSQWKKVKIHSNQKERT